MLSSARQATRKPDLGNLFEETYSALYYASNNNSRHHFNASIKIDESQQMIKNVIYWEPHQFTACNNPTLPEANSASSMRAVLDSPTGLTKRAAFNAVLDRGSVIKEQSHNPCSHSC